MCVPGTLETVRERVEREGPPRVSRRVALMAGAGAAASAALPGEVSARGRRGHRDGRTGQGRLVDLSHVFREDFPAFPGAPETSR